MKNSISQNKAQVKTVKLTDGSTRPIPTGCQDARAFQRIEEAKLQARLNPRPRKPAARPDNGRRLRRRTLATTVRFTPASTVANEKRVGKAMSEQVSRVNEPEADNSWFTINTGPGGYTAKVSRENNKVSYIDNVLNDNLKAGCCVRGW